MQQTCNNNVQINQDMDCSVRLNHCNNVHWTCQQVANTGLSCSMSQLSSIAQSATALSDSTANAGIWGIAWSSADSEASNVIQQYMNQTCSNNAIITQNLQATLDCTDSNDVFGSFLQKADVKMACFFNAVSKASQDSDAGASSKAQAFDPLSGLMMVVYIIIILGVVGVAVNVYQREKGSGGGTKETNIFVGTGAAGDFKTGKGKGKGKGKK